MADEDKKKEEKQDVKTLNDLNKKFEAIDSKIKEVETKFDERDPELKTKLDELTEDQVAVANSIKKLNEFRADQLKRDFDESKWTEQKATMLGMAVSACYFGQQDDHEKKDKILGDLKAAVEKADLGTPLVTDATTGSYTVEPQYLTEIVRLAQAESEIIPMLNKISMTGHLAYYPKSADVVEFTYISSDGGAVTEANPTFGQGTLTEYTYAMYMGFSEAYMEDNFVNIGNYLRTLISEALTRKIETETLVGSGAPTTGALNDTSANIHTMTGQAFASIDIDEIKAWIQELTTKAKRNQAMFMMHDTVWDEIVNMVDANGRPLIPNIQDMTTKMLRGKRVLTSDQLPDIDDSASGTKFALLGNPKDIAWGDRVGLDIGYYPNTQYKVTYLENFFLARFRAAFAVKLPANFAVIKTAS